MNSSKYSDYEIIIFKRCNSIISNITCECNDHDDVLSIWESDFYNFIQNKLKKSISILSAKAFKIKNYKAHFL